MYSWCPTRGFAPNKKWALSPLISPPAGNLTEHLTNKRVCLTRIRLNGRNFNRAGQIEVSRYRMIPGLPRLCKSAILTAMHPKVLVLVVLIAAGAAFFWPAAGFADDSAASIAAGGLVPRRETRIVMAKEILRISPQKVVVDYDFRNDTAEDVKTEVAFPVPPYSYGPENPAISDASFSDFKLFIDGKRVAFETEAKATQNGKDVTAILTADKIDIASFGHLHEPSGKETEYRTPDIERLSKPGQQRLVQVGLFDKDDGWGPWTVQLQYHWTQTFPAHSTVHIRHEYTPVEGSELMLLDTVENVLQHKEPTGDADSAKYARQDMQLLEGLCPDPQLLSGMIGRIKASGPGYGQYAHPHWVDFILTSANTWKQPIEDFTLIVGRGKAEEPDTQTTVSFCPPQNAAIEKLDADHFQMRLTNFVPKDELHIGYFDLPDAAPALKK